MTKKHNLITPWRGALLVGAVSVTAALAALADGGRPEFPISVAEATARADARFKSLDSDDSGEISADELAAAPRLGHGRRGHPGRGFGPGRGDRDNHAPPSDAELFERLDDNDDGQLSPDEFTAQRLREARRDAMRSQAFERLDADGSGGLSRSELPDMSRRLAAMDADGDGMVTREEARAHHRRPDQPASDRG